MLDPNPKKENIEFLNIDVFNDPGPNLLFDSQIPVPKYLIPFSRLIQRQIPVPHFLLQDPL